MILSIYNYDVLIGIGLLIGLSLLLTFLSEKKFNITILIVYMTIVNAFLVSTSVLDLWTQILLLIMLVAVAFLQNKNQGSSEF